MTSREPWTTGLVALGGAVGALLRWAVTLAVPAGAWPWVVLMVNVVGSAALAALVVLATRRAWPAWVRPALGTGLLGGFTTFSTFAVQVVQADPVPALVLLVATPLLCVGAAAFTARALEER